MARPSSPTATLVLLERHGAGEGDALDRVFARYLPQLTRYAAAHSLRGALRPRPDPEEVAQDAIARALASGLHEGFVPFRKGSFLRALKTVLDHVLKDSYRRQVTIKRSANVLSLNGDTNTGGGPLGRLADLVDEREPSPTSAARLAETIALCRRILPEREYAIWYAVEIEMATPAEVAEREGVTGASVRGVLKRARARVFRALQSGA